MKETVIISIAEIIDRTVNEDMSGCITAGNRREGPDSRELRSKPAGPLKIVLLIVCFTLCSLCIRLPYLLGENLLPDGDEAIVGVQALRFIQEGKIPLFFPGQDYGLTFFEALLASLGFTIFGVSTIVLKGVMFIPWLIGSLCFIDVVRIKYGDRQAFFVAGILTLLPLWILWSFKIRGGYLTAYCSGMIALRLLAAQATTFSSARMFFYFLAMLVAFLAQPLFFLSVVPFIFWYSSDRRKSAILIILCLFSLFCGMILLNLVEMDNDFSRSKLVHNFSPSFSVFHRTPQNLLITSSGYFYLNSQISNESLATTAGVLFLLLVVSGFYGLMGELTFRSQAFWILGFLGSIIPLLFLKNAAIAYRYWLPAVTFLIPIAAYSVSSVTRKSRVLAKTTYALFLLFCVAATISAIQLKDFRKENTEGHSQRSDVMLFQELVSTLQQNNVTAVYSLDPLLQWNIMFQSELAIKARWFFAQDRYPDLTEKVDMALIQGKATAIVGTHEMLPLVRFDELVRKEHMLLIGQRYFIILSPPEELLRRLDFKRSRDYENT